MQKSSERTFLTTDQLAAPREVIGQDERIQVTDRQLAWDPFTGILELFIEFPSEQGIVGTAWLITNKIAVTAGHNLISQSREGATGLSLRQAHSGIQVKANSYFVNERFRSTLSTDDDYGVIELERPIADAANLLYADYSDSQLNGETFNVVGFPADKPVNTMWFHSGTITSLSATKIGYQMDTKGGQSGAPVIDVARIGGQQKFISVGIHQGFDNVSENLAVRITSNVRQVIDDWKAQIGT